MTKFEKIESALKRIEKTQETEQITYTATWEAHFYDALTIALNMEIGKPYTFKNSDWNNEPYQVTRIRKYLYLVEDRNGYHALSFKQVLICLEGQRPIIDSGELFGTNRKEDINKMLFNYRIYRGKYKGLEINDNGVLVDGQKTVRRYFGKDKFEYSYAKYPLDNRYYHSLSYSAGTSGMSGPLTFGAWDISFETEKECIYYCINELIERFTGYEKFPAIVKYLNELINHYEMGIEVKYIIGDKYDIEKQDFEIVGKAFKYAKEKESEDEESEESEEVEETKPEKQLALF